MLLSVFRGDFNLVEFIKNFLLALPAFVLGLSMHEAAHGYIADRCGDPTARRMGRVTLNPLMHLDPMGFLFMLVAGVGWAKPVPVNPRNFKNPRRDDLLVSIAGVTMNLMLFLLGTTVLYAMVVFALGRVPASAFIEGGYFVTQTADGLYRISARECFMLAPYMTEFLIEPFWGRTAGILFEIFSNFAVVNLILAVFNLLPVPPLDGYHVVNDLLFKRPLFAPAVASRIGQAAILVLAVTGMLSKGLNIVVDGAFDGLGAAAFHALSALGWV